MRYALYGRWSGKKCVIGHAELTTMPGCPAVAISHAVEILPHFRGKGFGEQALWQRERLAKVLGYNLLIATVVTNNEAEVKTLKKNGWTQTEAIFNNTTTGKVVALWTKVL